MKPFTRVKSRTICQWKHKDTIRATCDLLYEIGRIETFNSNMSKAEAEFRAVQWEADTAKEYDLAIPENLRNFYQSRIDEALKEEKDIGSKEAKEKHQHVASYKIKW